MKRKDLAKHFSQIAGCGHDELKLVYKGVHYGAFLPDIYVEIHRCTKCKKLIKHRITI